MRDKGLREEDNTLWLWALLALLLHILLASALSLVSLQPLPRLPQTKGIAVEIIAAEPVNTPAKPLPAAKENPPPEQHEAVNIAPPPVEPTRPPATPSERPGGMIQATQLFAAAILQEPRNRRAQMRLRQSVREDQLIQLCNLEALEQVRLWKPDLNPDYLVAYARSEVQLFLNTLEADGGALHGLDRWYEIRYRCETSPDLTAVVAFEFAVGREIPNEKWETYALPTNVQAAD